MSNIILPGKEGKKMDIAVYGAGSMGTVLGAFLQRAGIAADLVSHDKAHIELLRTAGAKIGGTVSFSTQPFDGNGGRGRALLPGEMEKKYGIIFLLTKQLDNAAAAETLKNYLSPGGIVCTMQNGIPEPALAEILGGDRVLGCICIWGANKAAPGTADLTSKAGRMHFKLGGLPGSSHPEIGEVRNILEKIGPASVEANFTGARWSKLLINAAFSGMSAVTGFSFGDVAAGKISGGCALDLIRECIEVCRAAEIKIEPVQGIFPASFMDYKTPLKKSLLAFVMRHAMKNYGLIKSGMLGDLNRGRPCEIDAINGVVCQTGRRHNVPTPCNDRIVSIVHSIEKGELGYGPQNLKLFT
ncbi:MAG: 2-dehydropantoate 2-reductase [Treponema sp.]|nr:2-dehydropantoate 2-reductase [Treponema sp.]